MAAPVGVEALNIARNFLQSVRFVPLASKEVVRASAVGALWIIRATKITNDSSREPVSETIDDPRARPSDNACKTNPKVRVKPLPEVGTLKLSAVAVRGVVVRWALVEADLCAVGRGDRPESSSSSPNSTSASNSTVESFGESEPEPCANGPE